MAAQEFSSPGAHMASQSSSRGVSSNGVIYAPSSNNSTTIQSLSNSGLVSSRDRDSYFRDSHNYNQRYIDYNNQLFQTALDYDKYMSNTAIQRQVFDLKKAGLNPVLAATLGGASYKGVSAPYISVNPGSALSASQGFYNTEMQYDIAELNNSAQAALQKELKDKDFRNSFNLLMQELENYKNGEQFSVRIHEQKAKIEIEKYKEESKYNPQASMWGVVNSLVGRTGTYNLLEDQSSTINKAIKEMVDNALNDNNNKPKRSHSLGINLYNATFGNK